MIKKLNNAPTRLKIEEKINEIIEEIYQVKMEIRRTRQQLLDYILSQQDKPFGSKSHADGLLDEPSRANKDKTADSRKGCGKQIDALGYIHCGDEIRENGVPQGTYFSCSDCRKKGAKK